MNLFKFVFLDVVLLTFPILIYLIYLSTNKSIDKDCKIIYLELSFLTSFFLVYNYGIDDPKIFPVLVLNSIIILSYLEDRYVLANVLAIFLVLLYMNNFNCILLLLTIHILLGILYLIKKHINLNSIIFVEISILLSNIVFTIWIYFYNTAYFNLYNLFLMMISYFFITNILCLVYEAGKNILKTHISYKELQKEKQVRLSLFKITHEIKNPIAVCKGYLDMINVHDTKQVERYVPILKSEIERLLSLLQDFLLINKNNLNLDIMDINMLIEDTIDKMNPLLNEKNIKLELNSLDEEVFINGDYNRLSQVLINIIKNSIEAIPDSRKGKIKIITKNKSNKYLLIIEDNGAGMTKEIFSKFKDPFFTTKNRGSGLGVSLIYEILEAHDFKIKYETEYGKGTKAIIEIPLLNM